MWPQERFAINIFVMSALGSILHDPYNIEQVVQFLNSELSDRQITLARKIMEYEHSKVAALNKLTIPDTTLMLEWYKTKGMALQSIIHFFQNDEDYVMPKMLSFDSIDSGLKMLSKYVNLEQAQEARLSLARAFFCTKNALLDNIGLSAIFVASYSQTCNAELYKKAEEVYGIKTITSSGYKLY